MEPPPRRPVDVLLHPLRAFMQHELAGAASLLGCAVLALVWASSPWAASYRALLELELRVGLGSEVLAKPLHAWINDALMGFFFFAVGLEIKRELLAGELSTVRKATLPALAALGGMAAPAALYLAIAPASVRHGWGIPMATDIAFALGVLGLVRKRVAPGSRIFLTALAIVDDIGAVLVIAIFYTRDVSMIALGIGLGVFALAMLANALHVRSPLAYFVIGCAVWLAFLRSGVHATLAAVLMAFAIPARTRIDGESLVARIERCVEELCSVGLPRERRVNRGEQQDVLEAMDRTIEQASAPLPELQRALDPLVTFVVLPIFALANAGVALRPEVLGHLAHPIAIAIVVGLFVGKPIGIFGAAWLAVKLRLADLPRRVRWLELAGVAALGGMGFTMSLFIAALAFRDPANMETAKVAILCASLLSGALGWSVLVASSRRARA